MKKILFIIATGIISLAAFPQSYKGTQQVKSLDEKLNEQYCTGMFQSSYGTIVDIASAGSVNAYTNILDWLQGQVAGLQIFTLRSGVRIPVIRGAVPGIYIDEIPIAASYLQFLTVNDIAIIKVIKGPFYGSFNGGGGAIAIYTKEGGEDAEETVASR